MTSLHTRSPAGAGESAGQEEEEEGGDHEPTAELKKSVEEQEDEREEEDDEDEQDEKAKVDVTKAVEEVASTPGAPGEIQRFCEGAQLQSD